MVEYLLGRKEYMRQWRAKNKDKIKQYVHEWKKNNPDKVKNYMEKQKSEESKKKRRVWERKHIKLPHIRKKKSEYELKYCKNKYYTNDFWKLKKNIINSVRQSIYKGSTNKSQCKWEAIVGYDFITLKNHLEYQFSGEMSWENYGKLWSLDHIIPQCNWQKGDKSTMKEIWLLDNVRPILIIEHRKKLGEDLKYANRN